MGRFQSHQDSKTQGSVKARSKGACPVTGRAYATSYPPSR